MSIPALSLARVADEHDGISAQACVAHAALLDLPPGQHPDAVVAALAGLATATVRRHLRHLVRIGQAHEGTVPETYLAAGARDPVRPAPSAVAISRVTAWYLGCTFEAARVLGAAALPGDEVIEPDPARPPGIPADRRGALDWFARHRDRLTEILYQAVGTGDDARAWRLGLLMLNISCFAGPFDGWRVATEVALDAARQARNTRAQPMLHEFAGKLELTGGDADAARACHLRSLELRRRVYDVRAAVRTLNTLGVTWLREGSLPEALVLFTEALALAEEIGYGEFTAYAVMNLGAVHANDGHPEQAAAELTRAIAALRAEGKGPYIANALADLSTAYRAMGDWPRARQAAEAGEQAATDAGVPMFLPGPLCELAELDIQHGHIASALARLHEARAIYAEIGDWTRAARTEYRIDQVTEQTAHGRRPAPGGAAGSDLPDAPSTQEDAVNQDPLWLGPPESWKLGPLEARIQRTSVPLCEQAQVLLRLLAGAGTPLPVAVAGELAGVPTAVARRHLDQLVRIGTALRTGGGYAAPARDLRPIAPTAAVEADALGADRRAGPAAASRSGARRHRGRAPGTRTTQGGDSREFPGEGAPHAEQPVGEISESTARAAEAADRRRLGDRARTRGLMGWSVLALVVAAPINLVLIFLAGLNAALNRTHPLALLAAEVVPVLSAGSAVMTLVVAPLRARFPGARSRVVGTRRMLRLAAASPALVAILTRASM